MDHPAGGVAAPPTTSQTTGGVGGGGLLAVGVVDEAILLILMVWEADRRQNASRGMSLLWLCGEKKLNQRGQN